MLCLARSVSWPSGTEESEGVERLGAAGTGWAPSGVQAPIGLTTSLFGMGGHGTSPGGTNAVPASGAGSELPQAAPEPDSGHWLSPFGSSTCSISCAPARFSVAVAWQPGREPVPAPPPQPMPFSRAEAMVALTGLEAVLGAATLRAASATIWVATDMTASRTTPSDRVLWPRENKRDVDT